jgi:hypothetical protein
MKMGHWVGLAVFAVLFISAYSVHDTSHQAVVWFGIAVLLYFVFLKFEPAVARILLCMGGELAGGILVSQGEAALYPRYREGWDNLDLMMLSALASLAAGGVIGWYLVFRFTKTPGANGADTRVD